MRCLLLAFGIFVALLSFAFAAQVCVIDTRNCWRQKNVCARFGQSNLCQSFSNYCDMQSANCQQTAQYTKVNASLCSQLTSGVRGFCLGKSGSSGGYSGYGSSANVQPIVIRG
ncbi:uncharacterized protein LOC120773983 [Bactrocera tryoni]|uniref:uncharacterized protein LOC120773983 n=1 Tax=Bactrocera tryoni TaxID=59916 RepID=UPI001A9A0A78|nr:uncharacterized protein LOC120773983 [Bactrocera tryoni]